MQNTVYVDSCNFRFIIHDFDDIITKSRVFHVISYTNKRVGAASVKILVYMESFNILVQDIQYYKLYQYDDILQNKLGIATMIKAALRYILKKNVNETGNNWTVSIKDTIFIPNIDNIDNIHLTTMRLLNREKGWFEEHLDAMPTEYTKRLIHDTRNLIEMDVCKEIACKIYSNKDNYSFFTTENVKSILNGLHECSKDIGLEYDGSSLFSTSWIINQNIIDTYPRIKIIQTKAACVNRAICVVPKYCISI